MRAETRLALKEVCAYFEDQCELMVGRTGGVVRASKGRLAEAVTDKLVRIAWVEEMRLPGERRAARQGRLRIDRTPISVPIESSYFDQLPASIRRGLNREDAVYRVAVDRHVYVDERFIMAIECKAFMDITMLRRTLVDFQLLRLGVPRSTAVVLQLENGLRGDYAAVRRPVGSPQVQALLSYFPAIDLKVITLLEGNRRSEMRFDSLEHRKQLSEQRLGEAIGEFVEAFRRRRAR